MATKVWVTCTTCGDQEISSTEVSARVCVDNDDAEYRFTCNHCENTIVKSCDQDVVEALGAINVLVEVWKLPKLKRKARRGANLTEADLTRFKNGLYNDVLFHAALENLG